MKRVVLRMGGLLGTLLLLQQVSLVLGGGDGGPLPIMSCKQADKYPVNDLCRNVVGNRTISVQANLTTLEEYVGKTFRSLTTLNVECNST